MGTIEIGEVSSDVRSKVVPLKEKDWTVCIYMCGTDLETGGACATADILEMLAADIPENVNILMMTGGTKQWNPFADDKVAIENGAIKEGAYVTPDSEHTQVYRIEDDKMNLVYTYDDNMDMGDVCTLATFLELALYYAPAEHLMVNLWNHGGGPLSGMELARNTTWQSSMPMAKVDMQYVSKEERIKFFEALPFGTILYFNGHEMMYLGSRNGKYYATGKSIGSSTYPFHGYKYAGCKKS